MRRLPPGDAVRSSDRGQAHTLEAVIGALLLLTSVLFALQSTAVTPLSASTSSQHLEHQQRAAAQGLLAAAAENGSIKTAILYLDNETVSYHGTEADLGYYTGGGPNLTFAGTLNRTFRARGIAYNVYVNYQTPGNETVSQPYIYNGVPSDNAVSASWTVVFHDSDTLYYANRTRNADARIGESSTNFYMSDISPGTDLYNVARVEVVVWQV